MLRVRLAWEEVWALKQKALAMQRMMNDMDIESELRMILDQSSL